jgi:hypothetical protein
LDAGNTGLNKSDFRREKMMNKKGHLVIGAIAVATVMLLASSCTTSNNNQPIITSLERGGQGVIPLGSLQVTCIASDPDGDELSYDWSASGGEVSGDGDTVTWTAPASEGSYSVAVTVTDGHGGQVTDYRTIIVRANNPPAIASLIADAQWTTPLSSVQVTCTASDADGDELSYDWSASGGDISGTGPVVSWAAPQEVGTYSITVVVTDGYGGEDARSVSLSAALSPPLTIEGLIVTAEGHPYLTEITPGYEYKVLQTREYYIECIASDTNGGLVYEWSCDGGQISGGGSTITWTAPNTAIELTVTVTVVVSDGVGNRVSRDVLLQVMTCGCAF